MATGTTVPLRFAAFEVDEEGRRLRVFSPDVVLISELAGQFEIVGRKTLRANYAGVGRISLRAVAGGVTSAPCDVWSATARSMEARIPPQPLRQREKVSLHPLMHTEDGLLDHALLEAEVVEEAMGSIGPHGVYTAPEREGSATIRFRYGSEPGQVHEVSVRTGPETAPPKDQGGAGGDIPLILLCGTPAPGTEGSPEAARTELGGKDKPTVIAPSPALKDIYWINPTSTEAAAVRSDKGPTGLMGLDTKTFRQFIALKCFDILKGLKVKQMLDGEEASYTTYVNNLGEAEMECVSFIDAAYKLAADMTQNGQANG